MRLWVKNVDSSYRLEKLRVLREWAIRYKDECGFRRRDETINLTVPVSVREAISVIRWACDTDDYTAQYVEWMVGSLRLPMPIYGSISLDFRDTDDGWYDTTYSAFQPGMFPGGNSPPPEIVNSPGNFLQAAISWTGHTIYVAVIILEATLRTGISGYAVLGRQISKKIVHTAAAWSVITDAVAAAVPVVITD